MSGVGLDDPARPRPRPLAALRRLIGRGHPPAEPVPDPLALEVLRLAQVLVTTSGASRLAVTALIDAAVALGQQGTHEWPCPSCGATTRARMADR